MPRRSQFRGICHDVLASFASRNNDLNGYWAPGQFMNALACQGEQKIQFKLLPAADTSGRHAFALSEEFYREAVLRMMETQAMPRTWLGDATLSFSIVALAKANCAIEIVSDLGKVYRGELTINVRPHDPELELRRGFRFGPRS